MVSGSSPSGWLQGHPSIRLLTGGGGRGEGATGEDGRDRHEDVDLKLVGSEGSAVSSRPCYRWLDRGDPETVTWLPAGAQLSEMMEKTDC